MNLFFESFNYPKSVITECFGDSLSRQITKRTNSKDTLQIDCVGYFLQRAGDKCEPCFIMPKVFVWQKDVGSQKLMCPFGFEDWHADEKNIFEKPIKLDEDSIKKIREQWTDKESGRILDVIYELPMWIYSAMAKYNKKQRKNSYALIESEVQSLLTSKREENESTLLDAALSLKFFYETNHILFVFVWKKAHSGFNKIKWNKTIRKVTPIIYDDEVIYPTVLNKKKHIDWDEQLMCIFFNTLRFINKFHNVNVRFNEPYNLEPDSVFARKTNGGQIVKTLKRIKCNYFSDKMQLLWKLLYNYHAKLHKFRSNNSEQDYLLIRSFNNVFEDMIDELLGDDERTYPTDLKKQSDGKIVDHLFRHDSLVPLSQQEAELIFYIGDSKYYREDSAPTGTALYKQYTYAKNILQAHFNWYNYEKKEGYKLYRDDRTEGYNIIPNFFLSGYVRPDKKETEHGLVKDEVINQQLEQKPNYQWVNRLFDRDTLFLRQYDINFLFVLHAYIRNSVNERNSFKKVAKEEFKDDFLSYINGRYTFYSLILKDGNKFDDALRYCFRDVIGKIFMPYNDKNTLIMALENEGKSVNVMGESSEAISAIAEESRKAIAAIGVYFEMEKFKLGERIPTSISTENASNLDEYVEADSTIKTEDVITKHKNTMYSIPIDDSMEGALSMVAEDYISLDRSDVPNLDVEDSSVYPIMIGYTNKIDWVEEHNLYNMRSGDGVGSIDSFLDKVKSAKTLALYKNRKRDKFKFFKMQYSHLANKDEMEQLGYTKPKGDYHLVKLDESIEPIDLTMADLLKTMNKETQKEFMQYKVVFIN